MFLRGLSTLLAYTLMLVTMSYSFEFLICVVVGLMAGYYLFDGELYNYAAGTPCCTFLEDGEEEPGDETIMTTLVESLLPTLDHGEDFSNNGVDGNEHSCCAGINNNNQSQSTSTRTTNEVQEGL